ncbi:MAG TPA: hypothetical protein VNM35_10505 [Chitinophagaceae bacterium]|nr:hypothetical protein [Chitinophagaceae bacterium]
MKRILFFLLAVFTMNGSFGQLEFRNSNVGRLINLEDFNGRSLLKKYDPAISGSPFINADWIPAKITLSRGKEMGPLLVRLNIESNEVYFLDSTGKEMVALEGLIKKIDFINYYSKDSIRYIFKSGYPNIDKQNENYFYQVFTDGKIELLAKKFKYIRTVKDELSGEIIKDFVDGTVTLYVYSFDNMQLFQPKIDFVLSLLIDKHEEVNTFINANKINLKKTSDLIKLFSYYNKL